MIGKSLAKFISNILLFVISVSLVFLLSRLAFILDIGYFSGLFADSSGNGIIISDVLQALFNGMRYDSRIVGAVSIFYMVLYLALFSTNRRPMILTVFSMVFVFIIIAAYVGNSAFYKIFGDTYNIMLLGLIYDDRQAILHTALSGEYNVIFRFGVVIAGTMFFGHFYYRLVKLADKVKPWKKAVEVALILALVYVIAVMMSSTLSLRGGSIDYLITPSKNEFLRKASSGPLRDLHLVYISYSRMKGDSFEKYSGGATPLEAARIYFEDLPSGGESIDLNALMKQTVKAGARGQIDHIFVIVAESLSSWHFDEEFESVGLAAGLKELAGSENGKRMDVFIENAEGTIGAVDVMVTGLYSTGVPVSDRTGSLNVFNSSCKPFKNLGYENRFFYFGSPAWRKLDRYVLSQGFDKIYSIADMDADKRGVWGVADNVGFDFVMQKTVETAGAPTFNMILTTMYHPPYNMPLRELGVPVDNISALLDKNYPKDERYHETTANIVGHAYLADEMLADFIRKITERFPNSIVFLTGDHFDRMHPSKIREPRIKYGVPFIVYGKNVGNTKFIEDAGSQIDIIPTVMELTASKGFEYYAFGRPLLSLDKLAEVNGKRFALGYESVANSRFIADENNIQYLDGAKEEESDKTLAEKELLRDKMGRALSWWIINKGYTIPAENGMEKP